MNHDNGANGEGLDEERDLVAQACRGSRTAMRRIVERHQRAVFLLALGVLGDRHDAEDAMQEVFINALKSIGRFRGDSRLSTWLYSVTMNVCRQQQRRQRRASFLSLDALRAERPQDLPESDGAPDPQARVVDQRRERELMSALARLSFAERQVFALRKFQELSVKETAQVLGVAEGTVKALLFRGLSKLSHELDPGSGGGVQP